MGIGMQTEQSCCGAFTVAVGIIGLITTDDGKWNYDNDEGRSLVEKMTRFMLESFGTLHCTELEELNIPGYENPCHYIVQELAKKLEEIIPLKNTDITAYGWTPSGIDL